MSGYAYGAIAESACSAVPNHDSLKFDLTPEPAPAPNIPDIYSQDMALQTWPEMKAYSRYSRIEHGQVVATPLADHIDFREFSNLRVNSDYPELQIQSLINVLFKFEVDESLLNVAKELASNVTILPGDQKLFYTAGSLLARATARSKSLVLQKYDVPSDALQQFMKNRNHVPSLGDRVFGLRFMMIPKFKEFYETTSKLSLESFEIIMSELFNTWYYITHVPKIFLEAYNKIPTVKPLEDLDYFMLLSKMSFKRDRIDSLAHFRHLEVLQNSVPHSSVAEPRLTW